MGHCCPSALWSLQCPPAASPCDLHLLSLRDSGERTLAQRCPRDSGSHAPVFPLCPIQIQAIAGKGPHVPAWLPRPGPHTMPILAIAFSFGGACGHHYSFWGIFRQDGLHSVWYSRRLWGYIQEGKCPLKSKMPHQM